MTFWQALILGIIQGLTEFLPISSTAHMTLVGRLMGAMDKLNSEQWTAFMAVIQLGTLLAVLVYFAPDLLNITKEFIVGNLSYLRGRDMVLSPYARLGWYIIVGSIPIVACGLLFKKIISGDSTKNLYVISISLIIWAIFLSLAEIHGRRIRTIEQLTIFDAIFVGIAQAFALIPGSSRSGTTITAGLFVGLTRESAAKFSFLLSIPSIFGAGVYELYKYRHEIIGQLNFPVIVATIVAAIVGYISIELLIRYLQTNTTYVFVGYRIILGVIILALVLTKIVNA
ncbi:MAG: undecaprenyl-diphosphatase UppP [Acidobacteria bacterium]|nr:undecaprenyl-diphosphatase UppP [Acidobacteriota bacterium]